MRASLGCVGIPVLAAASLIGLMKVFSSAMECEVEVRTILFGGRWVSKLLQSTSGCWYE